MRNFGRGMWRRVDDYEKTPKFKESQYFAFLEYQKVKEMQDMVYEYRNRILTAINNITNVEPELTITEVIEDDCKQEIIADVPVSDNVPVSEEIIVTEDVPITKDVVEETIVTEDVHISEEISVSEEIPVSEEIIVTEDVVSEETIVTEEIPVLKEIIVTESEEIIVTEDVPKPKKGRRKNK